jgi:hypothetical protein
MKTRQAKKNDPLENQGKKSSGRPTKLTEEMKEKMFDLISTGSSINEIAGKNGFPDASNIYRRMTNDPDFATFIAQAREAQQEHEADYCVQLADSATPEDYNVKKLQIWARQWRAGKLAPKKYGDRVHQEITGANGGPITQASVSLSPEQEGSLKDLVELARGKAKK